MNASATSATAMITRRVYGSGLRFKRPTLSRSVRPRHRNDDHSAVGLPLTLPVGGASRCGDNAASTPAGPRVGVSMEFAR
jgi:hypothetical protein